MLQRAKKNKKGFTLVELIVVVAILAILAAIAIPSFIGLQERAQEGVDIGNATAIAGAINTFNAMQTKDTDRISTFNAAAKTTLETAKLWPAFQGVEANATRRLIFAGGVCTVNVSNPYKAAS